MRIAAHAALGVGYADQAEQLEGARIGLARDMPSTRRGASAIW